MTPDLPRRVLLSRECLAQPFGEGLVLLNTEQGVYYELDEVGARFWSLLAVTPEVETVLAALLLEFDVDKATLTADLARLVAEFDTAGLVALEA